MQVFLFKNLLCIQCIKKNTEYKFVVMIMLAEIKLNTDSFCFLYFVNNILIVIMQNILNM